MEVGAVPPSFAYFGTLFPLLGCLVHLGVRIRAWSFCGWLCCVCLMFLGLFFSEEAGVKVCVWQERVLTWEEREDEGREGWEEGRNCSWDIRNV